MKEILCLKEERKTKNFSSKLFFLFSLTNHGEQNKPCNIFSGSKLNICQNDKKNPNPCSNNNDNNNFNNGKTSQ